MTEAQKKIVMHCPVGATRDNARMAHDFTNCKIAVDRPECKICGKLLYTDDNPQCVMDWYVCPVCYPRECVARSIPENKTPTRGEIRYVKDNETSKL